MAEESRAGEHDGIVDGEEGDRCQGEERPRQATLFGDERDGTGEFAADEQIGAGGRGQKVGVHGADAGVDEVPQQVFRAALTVHHAPDEVGVGEGEIGADRGEGEALRGDFGAVGFAGGDHGRMAAATQFVGQREGGMEVAEGPEGGEDDAGHRGRAAASSGAPECPVGRR